MRARLRGARLVLKWSWKHRKLLNKSERSVARTDPQVWFMAEDVQPLGWGRVLSRDEMHAVDRYLADKYGIGS